jgi:Holliday junction resolvase RusA-like endonuclease
MSAVTFTVPGEPQGKGRARAGKHGHYTPAKTVSYEGLIAHEARLAMQGRALMAGPLEMVATAFLTVPASDSAKKRAAKLAGDLLPTKKPDFDNLAKALGDGCNKVVYGDDAQIVRAVVEKFYGDPPRVVVTVSPHSRTGA